MNSEQYARNLLAELRRKTVDAAATAQVTLMNLPSEWTATRDTVRGAMDALQTLSGDLERELEHVRREIA